jgi:hypothetical protein
LQIGGLALGGLALSDLLRLEARAGTPTSARSHKSVILVYLSGGLAHQDTFDLKPEAPAEVRGEFQPIATKVPGIAFGEMLPRLAGVADKLAVVRSLVGQRDEHSSFQQTTGTLMAVAEREGRPHFGSVVAKVQGPVDPVVPPFVDLSPVMQHRPYNSPGPGRLGSAYRAARLSGDDVELMRPTHVAAERVADRRTLLTEFDGWRRSIEAQPVAGMDEVVDRAFEVISSSRVATALDLDREDPRIRDRYGKGSPKHMGDGAPMWNDQLLQARRLVEAGARVVTVAYGFWDTHGGNFRHLKAHLPLFDQGISALVDDIHMRGMQDDVTVVVWGEFGRTPKINKDAGRDHWAPVNSVLFAGGGMNVGQVIGTTDKTAAYAVGNPIHYLDVLATIYHNLGIDPSSQIGDRTGRPAFLLPPTAQPIRQLVG